IGTLNALFQTIKLSLFSPTEFFGRLPPLEPTPPPPLGGLGSALLYAILVGVPSLVFGIFWQLMASSMGVMFGETREAVLSLGTSLVAAAFSPLMILITLLVTSLIFHLFLTLFGGARYSLMATFRVLCYASAPEILQIVPLCGGIASGIWCFVLCVIGLATVHRTSMSRSFAAVAVPAVACCGFVTLVALMAGVASLIGQWH
ncbi:MAG TPA: YIP1 family protein, partial [Candidatus Udaeobacter sp.]|nr:YIP1 family protein [Candidatus Udaeobacter sp.]